MATVTDTWTGNTEDGEDLDGSSATGVASWLTDLQAGINDIVDAQINASAGIQGSKLADATIPTAKYANSSVTGAKIANTTIKEGNLLRADATDGILGLLTAAPQRKIIAGSKAFDFAGPLATVTLSVDFSTDGHDTPSDPANTTDLTIITTLEHDGTGLTGNAVLVNRIDNLATTGFDCVVETDDGTTCTTTGTLHWIAIGRTA